MYANNNQYFTNEELQYIQKHPVITAHNETNWMPINFNENSIPKGFAIDYMNLLASKIGFTVQYISGYSWDEYMQMLQTNKIDLIINIAKNKEREKYIEFTEPFIYLKNAIYINSLNKDIFPTLESLKGRTIAMPKGFFMQKYIEYNFPEIKQVLTKDILMALQLLSLDKVDAVIEKKVVADSLIETEVIPNLKVIDYINIPDTISDVRIGTSKDKKILIDILNKAQTLISQEEISNLKKKWFQVDSLNKYIVNLTSFEEQYLKDKKSFNICVSANEIPLEYIENNKLKGLVGNYLDIMVEALNISYQIIKTNSNEESFEKIKQGTCDFTSLSILYKKWSKELTKTNSYFSTNISIVTKKNNNYIVNVEDNLDKKYAIIKNSYLDDLIKSKFPNLKIIYVENSKEGLELLNNNKVFAYIGNTFKLIHEIKNNYNHQLFISGIIEDTLEFSMIVERNNTILLDILNKFLNSIPNSEKILIKNNISNYDTPILIDYNRIFKLIIIILALIIALLIILYKSHLNKLKYKIEIQNYAKILSLSEMLMNISHQWKQPLNELNSIVMKLDVDYKRNNLDERNFENHLTNIEKLTKFMSNTIVDFSQMLSKNKELTIFNLKQSISNILIINKNMIEKNKINIKINIDDNIYLESFEGELKQVFMILLNNSKDAFIKNNIKDRNIIISSNVVNKTLYLSFLDNAGGIEKNIIERIFEPYFTTKKSNIQNGLGLYVAYIIISKSLQGDISVSNKEKGANFEINIPLKIKKGGEGEN